MFGLVGVEVIEDDMQFHVRVERDDAVHEVQKLPTATVAVMTGMDKSRGHLESRKQGCRTMTLILMAKPSHGLAVREAQPTLGSHQGLDGRLFIGTEHHCIFGWVQIQSHNVRRLLSKLGVGAYAPTPPPSEMDAISAQHPPHLVH